MKGVGTEQLLAMKFERLALNEDWVGLMGKLAEVFMILFYGESGGGKTTICITFAMELARFADVKWIGYETGHAGDIQDAVARQQMKGKKIVWVDPFEEKPRDKAAIDNFVPPRDMPMQKNTFSNRLFIALYLDMIKPKSAKYWFIDSADASQFTEEQVLWLRAKFIKKKGLIFIGHGAGKEPLKSISKAIKFYGQAAFLVKHFIAYPVKNRFGGMEPKVINEEKARELNPLFFEKRDAVAKMKAQTSKGAKVKTTKNKKPKATAPEVIDEQLN